MGKTTLDTLDELLEGAFDDVDDPDVRYKLRSARQLVQVIQQRHDTLDEAINDAVDDEVHVNTCESHASQVRRWLSPHRGVSKDKLTQYLRAFQLRQELFRKPGREALTHAVRATL